MPPARLSAIIVAVRPLGVILLICGLCLIAWQRRSHGEQPPGVLVRALPDQMVFTTPQPSVVKNGWTLKPLAALALEARVLGAKRYRDDFAASIAPFDLALGWGPMSDAAVLEKLDVTQKNRFYHWRFWGRAPIPEKDITTHSGNMHIIPADDAVLSKLQSLREGALVRLAGSLVVATHPKANKPWCTSLTRDDEGAGACEIFYVKSLTQR